MKITSNKKQVAIIMGSASDYPIMRDAEKILRLLKINFDTKIVSAHRTLYRMFEFAKNAHKRYKVIIAGAGGSAHLAGMVSSLSRLPVIGVPIETKEPKKDWTSLLSVIQMPKGIVTATVAINNANNAGLLAAQILALFDKKVEKKFTEFRNKQTKSVKIKPKK